MENCLESAKAAAEQRAPPGLLFSSLLGAFGWPMPGKQRPSCLANPLSGPASNIQSKFLKGNCASYRPTSMNECYLIHSFYINIMEAIARLWSPTPYTGFAPLGIRSCRASSFIASSSYLCPALCLRLCQNACTSGKDEQVALPSSFNLGRGVSAGQDRAGVPVGVHVVDFALSLSLLQTESNSRHHGLLSAQRRKSCAEKDKSQGEQGKGKS